MDILSQIVSSMNKEDIRFYKLYAERTNTGDFRKDVMLFDLIRTGLGKEGEFNGDLIFTTLYKGAKDKNAFYRLKNHLAEELSKSIFIQHIKNDELTHIYYLLAQYSYYYAKRNYKIALFFLKKAEKQAGSINHIELLDLIYGEFIKLSNESLSMNPEKYLTHRKKNWEKLTQLRQIDAILTVITFRLKTNQNYLLHDKNVLKMLEKAVDEFVIDEAVKNDPALKIKIFEVVSQILLQKHDYVSLEEYLSVTWRRFIKEKSFNKKTHKTKLQILTYLANTCFKNGKYNESLKYTEKLKAALTEYNGLYSDKYLFFYYNAQVINYSVLDPDRAIDILNNLGTNEIVNSDPYYKIFINLNLSIIFHDKGDYRMAIKFLNKLFMLDNYKILDSGFKLKVAMVELMIRFELKDNAFLHKRIRQIKLEYSQLMSTPEFQREKGLLTLIFDLSSIKKSADKEHLTAFLKIKEPISEETELINYNSWIRAKTKVK